MAKPRQPRFGADRKLRVEHLETRALLATVNVTTLGALPNDGINDAVIVQNALNNPAYDEVYFPPGTYHFDRSVFVPSNKTVRGNNYANTDIRTLADITPFRVDARTQVTIKEFTIVRPQTTNSNNEIVRVDNSSFVTIDRLRISNSGSRAPMINLENGNRNTVKNCLIYDYQVVRSETSAEQPGNHLQVFGSGITFSNESNITLDNCDVVQNVVLGVGTPVIKGWYQSSAIQTSNCNTGTVTANYIFRTGQGIDTSGTTQITVSNNYLNQIHSAGIKLVNGSDHINVNNNYLQNCGLTGIWLASGNAGLGGSQENVIQFNTLVGIGKGIGLNFWDGSMGNSAPAGIHLQAALQDSDRARNNTITDNNSYSNSEQLAIVKIEPANGSTQFPATNNNIANNVARTGNPPSPPALAMSAPAVRSVSRTSGAMSAAVTSADATTTVPLFVPEFATGSSFSTSTARSTPSVVGKSLLLARNGHGVQAPPVHFAPPATRKAVAADVLQLLAEDLAWYRSEAAGGEVLEAVSDVLDPIARSLDEVKR